MPLRVSLIIPCYNEASTIGGLLSAIGDQTFPSHDLEVVIADGRSTDGTRRLIEEFAANRPGLRLTLVDNPDRSIPAALNRAIAASQGPVVIRLDAHSVPERSYIERCLGTLERTQAANVGGLWEIKPSRDTWIGRAIAAAGAHPLGAGDARYRTSGAEAGRPSALCAILGWLDRAALQRGPAREGIIYNRYPTAGRGGVVRSGDPRCLLRPGKPVDTGPPVRQVWVLEGPHVAALSNFAAVATDAPAGLLPEHTRTADQPAFRPDCSGRPGGRMGRLCRNRAVRRAGGGHPPPLGIHAVGFPPATAAMHLS
jgi:hypothetical protein